MTSHDPHGHDAHAPHPAPPAPAGPPTDWATVRNVAVVIAIIVLVVWMLGLVACRGGNDVIGEESSVEASAAETEASEFLEKYSAEYRRLYAAASEAEWLTNTRIVEGDDTNAKRNDAAKAALAAFTGSIEVIETCRKLLASSLTRRPRLLRSPAEGGGRPFTRSLTTGARKTPTAPSATRPFKQNPKRSLLKGNS